MSGQTIQSRSPDEFQRSVEPHLAGTLRAARRMLKSHDLAEDALQEALWALWTEPKWPSDISAWLRKAITLRSLHTLRCQRRREKHEGEGWCVCAPVMDSKESVCSDFSQSLSRSLGALTPHYREVFLLCVRDELSYEAAAKYLEIPVGTVRSRLARARRLLREQLQSEFFGSQSLSA